MYTPLVIQQNKNCMPHPWHPSVVYIREGWNGYKYWMVQTPYPPLDVLPYVDRYELPCVHFSNDGIHWKSIKANPIDDLTEEMITNHNYYSDPHLLIRENRMECYYRLTLLVDQQLENSKTLLLRKTSLDGFVWSKAEIVADLRRDSDILIWGEQIISQAVIWDGSQYKCWYVDRSGYINGRKINLTSSQDGKTWNKYIQCSLCGKEIDPWHIDVQYFDDKYQMIVFDKYGLFWFESIDGVSYTYVSDIIYPTRFFVDFYSEGLYRACSVKVENVINIYFSAKNENKASIGLLCTKDRISFQKINGMNQLRYLTKYILPNLSYKKCKYLVKRFVKKCIR